MNEQVSESVYNRFELANWVNKGARDMDEEGSKKVVKGMQIWEWTEGGYEEEEHWKEGGSKQPEEFRKN